MTSKLVNVEAIKCNLIMIWFVFLFSLVSKGRHDGSFLQIQIWWCCITVFQYGRWPSYWKAKKRGKGQRKKKHCKVDSSSSSVSSSSSQSSSSPAPRKSSKKRMKPKKGMQTKNRNSQKVCILYVLTVIVVYSRGVRN